MNQVSSLPSSSGASWPIDSPSRSRPRTVAELRETALRHIPSAKEYSFNSWINAALESLQDFEEGYSHIDDPSSLDATFVAGLKVLQIFKTIKAHPSFPQSHRSGPFVQLSQRLNAQFVHIEQVEQLVKDREQKLLLTNPRLSDSSCESSNEPGKAPSLRLDTHTPESPNVDQNNSFSTIESRMRALRMGGLKDAAESPKVASPAPRAASLDVSSQKPFKKAPPPPPVNSGLKLLSSKPAAPGGPRALQKLQLPSISPHARKSPPLSSPVSGKSIGSPLLPERPVNIIEAPPLPHSDLTPQTLMSYMTGMSLIDGHKARVLVLDFRPHHEIVEQGRISAESVWIAPDLLERNIPNWDEVVQNTNASKATAAFRDRADADLVVFVDADSLELKDKKRLSSRQDFTLARAMDEFFVNAHTSRPKRKPQILKGGFNAWISEFGSSAALGRSSALPHVPPKNAGLPNSSSGFKTLGNGSILGNTSLETRRSPSKATSTTLPTNPADSSQASPAVPSRPAYSTSPAFDLPYSGLPAPPKPVAFVANSRSSLPSPTSAAIRYPDISSLSSSTRQVSPVYSESAPPRGLDRPPPAFSRQKSSSILPSPYDTISPRPPLPSPHPASESPTQFAPYATLSLPLSITGLRNLGNTCWMNATIQCLNATVTFATYFRTGLYERDINMANKLGYKGALANTFADLLKSFNARSAGNVISPSGFKNAISRLAPQFAGYEQQDAQEFLGFLLDGLHEDLNYVVEKPPPVEMTKDREHDLDNLPVPIMSQREWDIHCQRNDSFVLRMFQGQFRNQLVCPTCGKQSTTYNPFMPLSVPVPPQPPQGRFKALSLYDCIDYFVQEEILEEQDAWVCPVCKAPKRAIKRLSLSRLPDMLIIHLKRFSFDAYGASRKIDSPVVYPLHSFDLTKYLPAGSSPAMYDLYAVSYHHGNLRTGHYTAAVKSASDWYFMEDSRFEKWPASRVVSDAAYILYYIKR